MKLLFFQSFRGASAKNAGMCLSPQYAIQVMYISDSWLIVKMFHSYFLTWGILWQYGISDPDPYGAAYVLDLPDPILDPH